MKYLAMTKFILIFILVFSLALTGNSPKLVKKEKVEQLEQLRKQNFQTLSEIENQIDKYADY